MPSRPPDAATMTAISKGIDTLARMSGCPATSLTLIALSSDVARAVGIVPVGDTRDSRELLKARLLTQEQADAILGLLRFWYTQMKGRKP